MKKLLLLLLLVGKMGVVALGQCTVTVTPTMASTCASSSVDKVFTATLGTGMTNPTSIAWKYSPNGTTWTDVADGTPAGAVYVISPDNLKLTVNSISVAGDYQYRCEASGDCGPAVSNAAMLTVNETPACSITGGATTVCPGATTTYNAPAGLSSYLWSVAGAQIIGPNSMASVQVKAGMNGTMFTISLTVSQSGCSSTCTTEVSVQDSEPPTITTCPMGSQIVQANGACAGTVGSWTASTTATDNCASSPAISQSPPQSTPLSGHGDSEIVTMTASDGNGNSSTCSFTVTLQDQTDPMAKCPANITTNTSPQGQCSATVTFTIPAPTDNCGATPVAVPPPGTQFQLGTTTVLVTATDVAGLTSTCSFMVTVKDNEPPSITCPASVTLFAGSDCKATVSPADTLATASDNCTTVTITDNAPTDWTFGIGQHIITYTATDAATNKTTCTMRVTVVDVTPPVFSCPPPPPPYAANATCQYQVPDFWTNLNVTDCSTVTKTQVPQAGTMVGKGPHNITLTAKDNAVPPNSYSCSFNIEVTDQTKPTVQCPASTTVSADGSCVHSVVTYSRTAADVHDNCTLDANLLSSLQQTPASGTSWGLGSHPVTLTVTDEAMLSGSCTFNVTVVDNTPPTVTCPQPPSPLKTGPNDTDCKVDYLINNPLWDNCTGAKWGYVLTMATMGSMNNLTGNTTISLNVGTTTVKLTGTDGAMLTSTCQFNVEVKDDTPPTVTSCPPSPVIIGTEPIAPCQIKIPNYALQVNPTDNCTAPAMILESQDVPAGPKTGVNDGGEITVTYTASDAAMNKTTCAVKITVNDDDAPVITKCATGITVNTTGEANCEVQFPDFSAMAGLVATDNCSAAISFVSQSPAKGTKKHGIPHGETFSVVLTVTDGATPSNTATCSATVTVNDDDLPMPQCKDVTVDLSNPMTTAAAVNNNSSDNCTAPASLTLTWSQTTAFTCLDMPSKPVTLTVKDAAGNTAICTATVTVQDNIKPTVACPNPATVSLNTELGICSAKYVIADPISDNCSGAKWSATFSGTAPLPSDFSGIADGSNSDSLTFQKGSTIVTLSGVDKSSNTATANCPFTVIVTDKEAPKNVKCEPDQDINLNATCQLVVPNLIDGATAIDNCGLATSPWSQMPAQNAVLPSKHNMPHTITLTVKDNAPSPNTSTCMVKLTGKDVTKPDLRCKNITRKLNDDGTISISPSDVFDKPNSTDNCQTGVLEANLSLDKKDFNCTHVGDNIVTLTTHDGNGNTSACTATVTIQSSVTAATLSGAATICAGDITYLTVDIVGGTRPYIVTFTNGEIYSDYEDNTPTIPVSPAMTTTYLVASVEDANGCVVSVAPGSGWVTVTVNQVPKAVIERLSNSPDPLIENPQYFRDKSQKGDGAMKHWHWDFGDVGDADPTEEDKMIAMETVDTKYKKDGNKVVRLTVTDDNNCMNKTTYTLQISSDPCYISEDPNPPANRRTACIGDIVTIRVLGFGGVTNPPYKWTWTIGTPGKITPLSPLTTGVSGSSALTFRCDAAGLPQLSVSFVDGNGIEPCIGEPFPIDFTINPKTEATLTANPNPSPANEDIIVTCTSIPAGAAWAWSSPITGSTNPATIQYSETGDKNVSVTVTDINGCKDTAMTQIKVVAGNKCSALLTPTSFKVCLGTLITVQDDSSKTSEQKLLLPAYMKWDFGDNTSQITGVNQASHTYTKAGSYIIRLIILDDTGCPDTATASVTIDPLPIVTIKQDPATICTGTTFTLSADPIGANYKYEWKKGTKTWTSSQITIPNAAPADAGTYALTLTDANGCTGTAEKPIIVASELKIEPQGDVTVCDGQRVLYKVDSSLAVGLVWDINGGTVIDDSESNLRLVDWGTSGYVKAENCGLSDEVKVTVKNAEAAPPIFFFPNPDFGRGILIVKDSVSDCYQWGCDGPDGQQNASVSGEYQALMVSNDMPDPKASDIHYWVEIKCGPCGSTKIYYEGREAETPAAQPEKQFVLYPNPNGGAFTVRLDEALDMVEGTLLVQVFDMAGRLVFRQPWGRGALMDVVLAAESPSGVYVCQILGPGGFQKIKPFTLQQR